MVSPSRQRAEKQFAAIGKREDRILNEHDEAARAVNENMARLKAQRLEREAAAQTEKATRAQRGARKLAALRSAT